MASEWPLAVPPVRLGRGDVHVWRAELEQSAAVVTNLAMVLAADEIRKAERFHFARDRAHYIVAHAFLRRLLAAYVGVPPREIVLASGAYGKPHLVARAGSSDLRFNLSHSRGCALVALTGGCEVGVDIESMQPMDDADLIAKQFFSPSEQVALAALPTHLKHAAFYRCWSRKEAFIKVLGLGLAMPLDTFTVSLAPDEPALLTVQHGNLAGQQQWVLHDLPPIPHYATALALQGNCQVIHCFAWTP